MKIGYARVSTNEQELGLQLTSLRENGCEKIYEEKISGAVKDRPILKEVLKELRQGDILVVWKLDRLSRSLSQLIFILEELSQRGIELHSISDAINTSTSQSVLYIQIIGAIAQFERELIIERTKAGLEEAKRKGVVLGRKPGLSKEAILKAEAASNLYKTGMDVLQICKIIQISPGTFYRYLRYTKTKFRTK